MMARMTDRDSAFLWETEALRTSPQRSAEAHTDKGSDQTNDGSWVTLRQASRATGIPVETLRKWARRNTIPTHLTATPGGSNVRMVDLEGVKRRAAELGREIGPVPVAAPNPVKPSVVSQAPVASTGAAAPAEATAPPGSMIVPIDAWNKMLNQLGNLHEAGQQLAEARERAAKAETEAIFLRERLAEVRQGSAAPKSAPVSSPKPDQEIAPPPEKVWRYLIRRVRDRS